MEAADRDLHAELAKRPRDVHRARILVRLHADDADQAAIAADDARDAFGPDAGVGLVEGGDVDLDIVAEHAALAAIQRQPVQNRQRVGRNRRTPPLDDIAVVVVMRRLDQHERKALRRHGSSHPLRLNRGVASARALYDTDRRRLKSRQSCVGQSAFRAYGTHAVRPACVAPLDPPPCGKREEEHGDRGFIAH